MPPEKLANISRGRWKSGHRTARLNVDWWIVSEQRCSSPSCRLFPGLRPSCPYVSRRLGLVTTSCAGAWPSLYAKAGGISSFGGSTPSSDLGRVAQSHRIWTRMTAAGGRESRPRMDCQITRFSALSGARSGWEKSQRRDSAAPGDSGVFISVRDTAG